MIENINAPISTSTARDMVLAILEDVDEQPSIETARRISEEYSMRGWYIDPELLLQVWQEGEKKS